MTKIYIQATIARARITTGSLVMLITEDHQFFKIFACLPIAEKILLSRVDTVMSGTTCAGKGLTTASHTPHLKIVLAGEVVPGM